mmetsp:Transcript_70712/g.113976  ORF Transcript_70712/g.113976 Transcript_70712/m.113976 type:complete len:301 (-) Transcript_70712:8-910(-)
MLRMVLSPQNASKGMRAAALDWARDGASAPHVAVTIKEAAEMHARLCEYEESCDTGHMCGDQRFKTHLLLPWCHRVVTNKKVLDVVEQLLDTQNLLCWSSGWAVKDPSPKGSEQASSGCFYSWHQDSTYAGIDPPEQVVTVWLGLTPSNSENGCVRVVPGSHSLGQLPHDETFADKNMLARGQTIDLQKAGLELSAAVDVELLAGEFSVHHFHTVHGSEPNHSPDRRIGLQIVYMPTSAKMVAGRGSALLVRGEDRCGNWQLEKPPQTALGPDEHVEHARAMAVENGAYHEGSKREGYHR